MRLRCSVQCVVATAGCRVVMRGVWGVVWKMADSPPALSSAVPVMSAGRGEVRSNGYLGRREDAGGTRDGGHSLPGSSVVAGERAPCSSSSRSACDGRGGDVRARRVVQGTYICVHVLLFVQTCSAACLVVVY